MGLPLIHPSEPMHVDTSSLSKMEMIEEIGFPKRPRAAGPGGLHTPFFKDGGKSQQQI